MSAGQGDGESRADGTAINGGDDRFWKPQHLLEQFGQLSPHRQPLRHRLLFGQFRDLAKNFQVDPGTKVFARAHQQHGTDGAFPGECPIALCADRRSVVDRARYGIAADPSRSWRRRRGP